MRPIRSDYADFSTPLSSSPYRGQKSKGLTESAYATELRVFVA